MMEKVKSFFSKDNRAQWSVFFLFALTIFVKCTLFQWNCFHSLVIASLWRAPISFFAFWCPKIAISLFVASFVFVFRRNWWTILFCILLDLWILANLIYFRSNATLLDVFALSMAGNMKGFWSSIWLYCYWQDGIYFLLSLCYSLILIFFPSFHKHQWSYFTASIIFTCCIHLFAMHCISQRHWAKPPMYYNPFPLSTRMEVSHLSYNGQVSDFSILHSVGFIVADMKDNVMAKNSVSESDLSANEIEFLSSNIKATNNVEFDTPLILIIVESLEDWAVNSVSTPCLYNFMQSHPCFHASRIKKQTMGGTSADGQMLLNTGLLPTKQGAACFRFPMNMYPSIGECCKGKAATVLPHEIDIWNQNYMSPAYAYDTTIIRNSNDSLLFQTTIDCMHNGYQMVQTITMSSHSPFHYGASRSNLELPSNMPSFMSDYLKSIHYTDAGMQVLLSQIDNDSILSRATIVITGDHTVFPDEQRADFTNVCLKNNFDFGIEEAFVPLIIYSPQIKSDIVITDTCFQMDMYPTIMHLLGCEEYYWRGFGVNLLDSSDRYYRQISEKEAFDLSDKLIRCDYFANRNLFLKTSCKMSDQNYIAHAGGNIGGFSYTNSLEAVQNSIDNGIAFVELDLSLTSDSQLVASHYWNGCEEYKTIPSYTQFMDQLIYGHFTPLDARRIDSIMMANPQLHLVTDKISDPQIINTNFYKYKDRVWVECFSDEDYFNLEKMGYHVLRSGGVTTKIGVILRCLKHFSFKYFDIVSFTVDCNDDNCLRNFYGDTLAVFAGEDISTQDADMLFTQDKRIKFVYVDHVNR